jgi:hypothetical protein
VTPAARDDAVQMMSKAWFAEQLEDAICQTLLGGSNADEHAAEASAGTIHLQPILRQNISTRGLTNAQVGRTLMGTQQMRERAGGKGRCVELLHAFGDMLCAFGSFCFFLGSVGSDMHVPGSL